MRYLLVGNYGVGNCGDEALKHYFLDKFPEIEWVVCSASPERGEVWRLPAGIRSFFTFRWLYTFWALYKSDGMVFGGGSLFTDVESVRACIVWFLHSLCAWVLGKPIIMPFQGIGPFNTAMGEFLAQWVVKHSDFISTRDNISTLRAQNWMLKKNKEIVQSFDPLILFLPSKKQHCSTNNVFVLIPKLSTSRPAHLDFAEHERIAVTMSEFCRNANDDLRVEVVSLQPRDDGERMLCAMIARECHAKVHDVSDLRSLGNILANARCVITQRYHGAIAAIALEVPFIAIRRRECDKLDELAKMCGCASTDISHFTGPLMDVHSCKAAEKMMNARKQCIKLAWNGHQELLHYCAR